MIATDTSFSLLYPHALFKIAEYEPLENVRTG